MSANQMFRPPRPAAARRSAVGLDLGQRSTPAAVVAAEVCDGDWEWDAVRWGWVPGLAGDLVAVRWVEAMALGTPYTMVAQRAWEVVVRAGAGELCFDATGVGNGVVELLQQTRPPGLKCRLRPIVITGGQEAAGDHVPRWQLLQRLALEWEKGRVRVAEQLPGWPALRQELLGLDAAGKKRADPDDRAIALALALAVWGLAEKDRAGERGDGRLL